LVSDATTNGDGYKSPEVHGGVPLIGENEKDNEEG